MLFDKSKMYEEIKKISKIVDEKGVKEAAKEIDTATVLPTASQNRVANTNSTINLSNNVSNVLPVARTNTYRLTTGMNSNSLNNYIDTIGTFESDKDENGDSIKNSLKNKKYEYINSLDLTANEKRLLFAKNYEPSESDKAEIVKYINSLDLTADEKYDLLKQLKGVKTDKNGNISW